MAHTAQVQLTAKTVNPDGTIQVTFDDGTGYLYGDESALIIDCQVRDSDLPAQLKSLLVCLLVDHGVDAIGTTLYLDLDDAAGNIVKVL